MNKDTLKAKAKALQSFMSGKGFSLKYSTALEAIARIEGLPSYNVLQSRMDKEQGAAQAQGDRIMVSWDVEVCRVGYAHATVIVKGACTFAEAARRALDDVSDDEFSSENSSDYYIVGKEDLADSEDGPDDEQPGSPRDWEVSICRRAYGTNTLCISGIGMTLAEAEELALDEAGNHYYSTTQNKYVISGAYPCPCDTRN